MKIVTWGFWLLVFAAALLFAVRNTDPVTVRFYLESRWEVPLVLACTARLLGQRREIVGLKRELRSRGPQERASSPPEAAV